MDAIRSLKRHVCDQLCLYKLWYEWLGPKRAMFGNRVRAVPQFIGLAALWLVGKAVMRLVGKRAATVLRERTAASAGEEPSIMLVRDPETGIYRPRPDRHAKARS